MRKIETKKTPNKDTLHSIKYDSEKTLHSDAVKIIAEASFESSCIKSTSFTSYPTDPKTNVQIVDRKLLFRL